MISAIAKYPGSMLCSCGAEPTRYAIIPRRSAELLDAGVLRLDFSMSCWRCSELQSMRHELDCGAHVGEGQCPSCGLRVTWGGRA